jgi:hypothetical protein
MHSGLRDAEARSLTFIVLGKTQIVSRRVIVPLV